VSKYFKGRDQLESRWVWKVANDWNSSPIMVIDVLSFFHFVSILQIIFFLFFFTTADWIGCGLLNRQCAAHCKLHFPLFLCVCRTIILAFANCVRRCYLLLPNHAVQPISRSSAWYLANRKLPQYIGRKMSVPPTGKELQTGSLV